MRIKRMFLSLMSIFALVATLSITNISFAADGYLYTSERFGYSIKCPEKPTTWPRAVLIGHTIRPAKRSRITP